MCSIRKTEEKQQEASTRKQEQRQKGEEKCKVKDYGIVQHKLMVFFKFLNLLLLFVVWSVIVGPGLTICNHFSPFLNN